jgi:hypothetical protein
MHGMSGRKKNTGICKALSSSMEKLTPKAVSELKKHISRLVNKPLHLTITDNTYSMISIRPAAEGYKVRLHHMFLEADAKVLAALADFIKSPSKKAPVSLRNFVTTNSTKIRQSPPMARRTVLRPNGRFFDLKAMFNQLNREYFENKVDCLITWGANRRVRNQNSIKLASYSEIKKIIRVNPVLDRSYVPQYVVKGIIYHEMLHHHLGVELENGRKIAHSKTFRQFESRYRHYDRLQAWKEKNLPRLLGR